ncbi:pyridoxal phosphate-dependent aminotransferase [Vibrio sp. Y20_XG_PY13]|uniref:pyridoxal phosphate-dependent aminotransferase n=1 Tax=Vibrio sp. Y20_XG_PY13 TaxID=2957761 RepID=UPI0020A3D8F2|nr:pyridoxal phosphate-dependent aminotransferase [Vibrio sp. Y20_XG_PY13]
MHNNLLFQYENAKRVLSGNDLSGKKSFSSMFDKDVISLSHGDGTRRPHPSIICAGVMSLLDHNHSPDDYHVMTENTKLVDWVINDFLDDQIPPELASNVLFANGSTSIFDSIFTLLSQKNKKALVPSSFYHNLIKWSDLYGVPLICDYTSPSNDYKITSDNIENQIKNNDIDVLFLFNPTQTGAIYTEKELSQIAETSIKHNLMVFVDSVFAGTEFIPNTRTPQLGQFYAGYPNNLVTIKSASKVLNLANQRVGWACGGREIIQRLKDISSSKNPSMNNVSLEMVRHGLEHCRSYIKENNAECAYRASLIESLIFDVNNALGEELVFIGHKPVAGHGILLDFDNLASKKGNQVTGVQFCEHLLRDQKLSLSPADSLGFNGCKARIAFSSVGLKQTYIHKDTELMYIISALTKGSSEGLDSLFKLPPSENYFSRGRELLIDALTQNLTNGIKSFITNRA